MVYKHSSRFEDNSHYLMVSVSEFRKNFDFVLNLLEHEDVIIVTKYRRVFCYLLSPTPYKIVSSRSL